ncbi:uncharacterized protein M6B38_118400 [Iris pallida]|uniref:CCHC-type domain-containing protein n=1 Tax=Iris pallida TaxID=29817 RepID=A0AAX6HK22_IRIPA|nr:uncharacterized protein M6B38_118400 [Iris pallida]
MVSKRQKLARKRFRESNSDRFPEPSGPAREAAPPEPASKKQLEKKKKLKALKEKMAKKKSGGGEEKKERRRRSGGGSGGGSKKRHPLRVAGMRPGESCYICKSADHIAKLCPQKSLWEKNKICLLCRQRGHSLKNCSQKSDATDRKFCYNCGEAGHALSKCPLPLQDGGTKFASCFVCNERGHLSKDCPKSSHGIYPKGGCCKLCGGVTHLAKDCPNRGSRNMFSSTGANNARNLSGTPQGKRTVFHSGDDLEDDFVVQDDKSSKKETDVVSNSGKATAEGGTEKNVHVKPKKEQGPKVVNFFG